jgi:GntR family transcriptional regulator of vanillate catabolism
MATRGLQILSRLREGVLAGEYTGGMRMNEADLAAALGVSRTPIRNALSTLGAEGLLDYTPNSGYVVRSYSSRDIANIYEVRATMDGLTARLAAEQGLSDSHRGIIHKIVAEGDDLVANERWSDEVRERWMSLNQRFHDTILEAANNDYLASLARKARDIPLLSQLRFRWFESEDLLQAQQDHTEIFDAVVNGQGSRAQALAYEHSYRSGRRIVLQWRKLETKRPERNERPTLPRNAA